MKNEKEQTTEKKYLNDADLAENHKKVSLKLVIDSLSEEAKTLLNNVAKQLEKVSGDIYKLRDELENLKISDNQIFDMYAQFFPKFNQSQATKMKLKKIIDLSVNDFKEVDLKFQILSKSVEYVNEVDSISSQSEKPKKKAKKKE